MNDNHVPSLQTILKNNNVVFDANNKIKLPENTKRLKIDRGLSFDAPHSQNWIDHDIQNGNDTVVFGFEPNPNWINWILSPIKNTNFKDYHTYTKQIEYCHLNSKFFLAPVALGDVDRPTVMNLYIPTYSEGCCSLLKPNPNTTLGDVQSTVKVPVYSLSDFFDLIPFDTIEYIDYLKVDVQGYDINVLKSAGKYLSEKVVYVTAEPETVQYLDSQENSVPNMVNYMTSIGFIYIDHPNTEDPTFINSRFLDKKDDIYIWQHY